MDLLTLPDDVLLLVLGLLEARQLFQCRAVCRRLRDFALHPALWRKRRLHLHDSTDVQLVAATLRLAPRLGLLSMDMDHDHLYVKLGTLLSTSNCAIYELRVYCSGASAVSVAIMLVRQAALGRLRTSDLRLLMDQLHCTRGGTSLTVYGDSDGTQGDFVPASLRRLQFHWRDGSLTSFLRFHADTLQVVQLGSSPLPVGVKSLPCTLRELHCPILADMPALLHCTALSSLYLHVDINETTRPFLRGLQEFLCQAVKTLETLTLKYYLARRDQMSADEANLVLCLAGTGSGPPPALRSLSLLYSKLVLRPQPVLAPLASILHKLESLVSLNLGGAHSADFLQALDGRAVPRLERLQVLLSDREAGVGCPHEWAHSAETRALLRRYPRLHLEVLADHPYDGSECQACDYSGCDACKCDYCEENTCHFFDKAFHVLFSHAEQEPCNHKRGYVPFHVVL